MPKGHQPARVPVVIQDNETCEPPTPPLLPTLSHSTRQSSRLSLAPSTYIRFSSEAVYTVLATALEKKDVIIPQRFETNKLTYDVNFDLQEYCAGAIHPKTNETITSYKKLANNPLLQKTWMKAMCKELGNIAQVYEKRGQTPFVFLRTNKSERSPRTGRSPTPTSPSTAAHKRMIKTVSASPSGATSSITTASSPPAQPTSQQQNYCGTALLVRQA